jgi:hypothetical protein
MRLVDRSRKGNMAFEAIMGVAVCLVIAIATAVFMAQMQPVNNVITSEAAEADLIRAIYINEYARSFIKYGMKFMLESGLEELAARGGIKPPQSVLYEQKTWFNMSSSGNLDIPQPPIDKEVCIPIDPSDGIVFYRWCNYTWDGASEPDSSKWQGEPVRISDLATMDMIKTAIGDSLTESFSLTPYLAGFSRFTHFFPIITAENQATSFSDTNASASGDFRVVVKLGSHAGVNSSEHMDASVPTDLYARVQAAHDFVTSSGDLDNLVSALDYCTGTTFNATEFLSSFESTLNSTDVGSYPQWASVAGNGAEITKTGSVVRCMYYNTVHHLDPGFKFRTEILNCMNCVT